MNKVGAIISFAACAEAIKTSKAGSQRGFFSRLYLPTEGPQGKAETFDREEAGARPRSESLTAEELYQVTRDNLRSINEAEEFLGARVAVDAPDLSLLINEQYAPEPKKVFTEDVLDVTRLPEDPMFDSDDANAVIVPDEENIFDEITSPLPFGETQEWADLDSESAQDDAQTEDEADLDVDANDAAIRRFRNLANFHHPNVVQQEKVERRPVTINAKPEEEADLDLEANDANIRKFRNLVKSEYPNVVRDSTMEVEQEVSPVQNELMALDKIFGMMNLETSQEICRQYGQLLLTRAVASAPAEVEVDQTPAIDGRSSPRSLPDLLDALAVERQHNADKVAVEIRVVNGESMDFQTFTERPAVQKLCHNKGDDCAMEAFQRFPLASA